MTKRRSVKELIETYKEVGGNYTQAALSLGISRRTVKRWVLRGTSLYGNITFRGIERRSTKPHTVHRVATSGIEAEIVSLRRQTGLCAKKLNHLLNKKNIALSVSTIERILRKKGLHKRTNKYYRRPLFQNGHAMRPKNTNKPGYLQMDVKYVTPELSGLPYTCYAYGIIDIFSRLEKAPKDINELNVWFQKFLQYYNTERPHLGIELMTPKEKLDTVTNVMKD